MTFIPSLSRRLLFQYVATIGVLILAAEVFLYLAMCWAGQRELDTLLQRDIARMADAISLHPERPEVNKSYTLDWGHKHGPRGEWQVLLLDGTNVNRSRSAGQDADDLPAIMPANVSAVNSTPKLPLDQLRIADGRYGDTDVRFAQMLTLRSRADVIYFTDFLASRSPPGFSISMIQVSFANIFR